MKATGIVRRVDDLGRIVIPKEIRRSLRIHEGDPLEIFTDQDSVIFKKYSVITEISEISKTIVESLRANTACNVMICDKERVQAYSGAFAGKYNNKRISIEVRDIIDYRTQYEMTNNEPIKLVDEDVLFSHGTDYYSDQMVYPIVVEGDIVGALALFEINGEKITEQAKYAFGISLDILSRYLQD